MRKIMGNKPLVGSAIIIHSPLQISWNDLLHQGQTADVSIIRAKTGTCIETLSWYSPGTLMGGLVWFDKTVQACQGPTSFIAYERGLAILEYSHVFRTSKKKLESDMFCFRLPKQKILMVKPCKRNGQNTAFHPFSQWANQNGLLYDFR
jgi:hypothetical protein